MFFGKSCMKTTTDNHVEITFTPEDGYALKETRAHVGADRDDIPTKRWYRRGNRCAAPNPWKFEFRQRSSYRWYPDGGARNHVFRKCLSELVAPSQSSCCGQDIVMTGVAWLRSTTRCGRTVKAWTAGDPFCSRSCGWNRWAMFDKHELACLPLTSTSLSTSTSTSMSKSTSTSTSSKCDRYFI